MSDQARAFCGNVITQMCDYLQIDKIRTSPYHPKAMDKWSEYIRRFYE